jgi:tRNA modification GTPase
MAAADLTLHLVDVTQCKESVAALHPEELLVFNKIDLLLDVTKLRAAHPDAVFLSCKTGEGLEELKAVIVERVTTGDGVVREQASSAFSINARHQVCLQRALTSLEVALELFENDQPPELLAVELHEALQALGDVVGESSTEDILGEIFSNFCIGK